MVHSWLLSTPQDSTADFHESNDSVFRTGRTDFKNQLSSDEVGNPVVGNSDPPAVSQFPLPTNVLNFPSSLDL
ncbi:unnamed protein product [Echinostoma caproni]|uniref:ICA69 domain-containing protein n=1 Tax=Echinostoma caproni TaxID=27848 RepID=A0A183B4B7_9TREM|nr:unnamed protein product [Echinostoma caproni]